MAEIVNPITVAPQPPQNHIAYEIIEGASPFVKFAVGIDDQNGLRVEKIAEDDTFLPNPTRAKGTRTVADLDSFLAELARRPLTGVGTLWGNAGRGTINAVYNDHDDFGGAAGWRDDQLALTLTADPDWTAWHNISGKLYPQVKFGDVIEELLHTIVTPDQADLLEIIDSIRASSKGEFESGITRSNGSLALVYKQENTLKAGRTGQLEIPQTITLRLRPWENHRTFYDIDAWFRVSVSEGDLALAVKLKPTAQIVRQAWEEVTGAVLTATDKPVYSVK